MTKTFRAIFVMLTLVIIGVAVSPFLDISSMPREQQGSKLEIHFSWPNASAKVIEQNVTSRIEGLVSSVKGISEIASESQYGRGNITIKLKPETNPSAAKFEISSLIKQIHKKLPDGVSYPAISGGEVVTGEKKASEQKLLLTYTIHSDMSGQQLKEWAKRKIEPKLKQYDNITQIEIIGGADKYLEVTYDPLLLQSANIQAYDIEDAIRSFLGKQNIIGDILHSENGTQHRIALLLQTKTFQKPLEQMPIKINKDNPQETVYLNDLATYQYRDRQPDSYYRVNGLETVYLNIYVAANSNMISLSNTLRPEIKKIEQSLPDRIQLEQTYDGAEKEQGQLYRLVTRSAMSILILLLFVFVIYRSWRYLLIVSLSLLSDISLSIIAYYLFDIRLHIFSLAGITVSLGLVIDASIVMIDHYCRYRNRKTFLAILAALLTTIGSLSLICFMPQDIKRDLTDFSWIIIINLTVAMIVAFCFVPALIERTKYFSKARNHPSRARACRLLAINKLYCKYIYFCRRFKWICYVALILAFGIPLYALPDKWNNNFDSPDNQPWYAQLYDATLGSNTFVSKIKNPLSKYIGGTMRLFAESLSSNSYSHEQEEMTLNIRAQMPQGGTAGELNDKVLQLEDLLKTIEGIRRWETSVVSWGASIRIFFTPKALETGLPYSIENKIIGKVIRIGGAEWSTSGVSQRGFSNSLNLQYRANNIEISGYNYERLYRYAEDIEKILKKNPRAVDIIIQSPGHEDQPNEYYVKYDKERIALLGIDIRQLHSSIAQMLEKRNLGRFNNSAIDTEIQIQSSRRDIFDLWQLENSYISIGSQDIMLGDVLTLERREAKEVIPRKNQEYILRVSFNVLGSYTYANKYIKAVTQEVNAKMPIGYKCSNSGHGHLDESGQKYWLICVVAIIIFFICSILFESLSRPFAIIMLIPASLIGTFLTFYITGIPFGTGGFASMILLCGLAVNSGIYLLYEYDHIKSRNTRLSTISVYTKAFNHKIIPIILTVLSTIAGLCPYLIDGSQDPFWYSFAIGIIGGLVFSVPTFILFFPLFESGKRISLKNTEEKTSPLLLECRGQQSSLPTTKA